MSMTVEHCDVCVVAAWQAGKDQQTFTGPVTGGEGGCGWRLPGRCVRR